MMVVRFDAIEVFGEQCNTLTARNTTEQLSAAHTRMEEGNHETKSREAIRVVVPDCQARAASKTCAAVAS